MSYTALARRYRSQEFDEVVGQEPVARTLRAAIEADRVAHAYLFTGTRGVGKTTMARLFAKALNSNGTPEVDAAIMSGQDTDVVEIDGASNNSVENARDLIAGSGYRPMRGPYKIYIIDEVHMLSAAAFNALLKTMEEPPSHVKFILCTTEAHKVPATIQSRCQRFDFRAIPASVIADRLGHVVRSEGLKAEPALLSMVARLGNGSMRDALSLLDRLMASGEKHLTAGMLEELLGLAPRELVGTLIDGCATGEPARALEASAALLGSGASVDQMLEA
jgi:DNA polymerase-3 subunit gamma/tau